MSLLPCVFLHIPATRDIPALLYFVIFFTLLYDLLYDLLYGVSIDSILYVAPVRSLLLLLACALLHIPALSLIEL